MALSSELVQAVLDDWRTAPVDKKLQAMLGFLEKLTLTPDMVGPEDIISLRTAGVDDQATEDALHVCMIFNMIDRIADALDFDVPSSEFLARHANTLLRRGYR